MFYHNQQNQFFPHLFYRTFTAVHLNEKSLSNIYSIGVNLLNLNLAKCHIRSLPPNMFHFIPNLKQADLTHNYLCSLPMSLAHHMELEVILLEGNLFTSYPVILESLPKLKHHDLLDLYFQEQVEICPSSEKEGIVSIPEINCINCFKCFKRL